MGEHEDVGGSASKLIESLREFVHEQNGTPAEAKPEEPRPGWKDILWLVVLIADAAMIYSWISEYAKGPIEFLDKFLPWLLGGLWAVANAWFRDKLLAYSRLPWLRWSELAFLIFVGAPYWLPVIPITPRVEPRDAPVTIDADGVATGKRTWLTLREHTIILGASPEDPPDPVPLPRTIKLDRWSLLRGIFDNDVSDWHRVYLVFIKAPNVSKIRITIKGSSRFDDSFLDPANLQTFGFGTLDRVDKMDKDYERAVQFDYKDEKATTTLSLPSGDYEVAMSGCAAESLPVKPMRNRVALGPCKRLEGSH